jgi:exosortase
MTAIVLLAIAILLPPAVFLEDTLAAARLWWDSSAYGYCLLVPPVSLIFMLADKRALSAARPHPSLAGALVTAAAFAAWLAGRWGGIAELRQLAVVGAMQGMALGFLGRALYARLRFPMLYLFLAVPSGTVLLPPLQLVTVWTSSLALGVLDLPVTVDGDLITAPLRTYRVEPACAGLNYLLVALALALPFARVAYRSLRKRCICVAAAIAAAILANGLRVAAIIALPELTGGRIDIIADHKVFGWAIFAGIAAIAVRLGIASAESPDRCHQG